jgi:hypothetical protein
MKAHETNWVFWALFGVEIAMQLLLLQASLFEAEGEDPGDARESGVEWQKY